MELYSPILKNSYVLIGNLQSSKNKQTKKSALKKFVIFLQKKLSSHFVVIAD